MPLATSIVETTSCRTAGDLLDATAGAGSLFNAASPYSWLFRGVAKTEYTLTPSALRAGILERFNLSGSDAVQIDSEWKGAFFELANLRGMPLPEHSQRMQHLSSPSTRRWPHGFVKAIPTGHHRISCLCVA